MNRVLYRGRTKVLKVTVERPKGTLLDITGAQFWFTAKRRQSDPDASALIRKQPADSGFQTISNQVTNKGEATLVIAAADTVDPVKFQENDGRGVVLHYEIPIKTTDGVVQTIDEGELAVLPVATQGAV